MQKKILGFGLGLRTDHYDNIPPLSTLLKELNFARQISQTILAEEVI